MSGIVTITFNPCIDKSTTIPSLAPEKKLRCSLPKFEPGGGGLNVSRAIKKLGGDSLALFPTGGYSGNFLKKLAQEERIRIRTIDIKNHTRENLIVLDTSNNNQYRFGMPGPELFEEEWKACLQVLEEEKEVAFVVASGSLSPGIPDDIYAQIASIAKKKGAKLVIDTSGEALHKAVHEGVFMIKPNLHELSSLVGMEEVVANEVDDVAKEIINKGQCELIVVSLGPAGAMAVTKNDIFQMTPPVVKKKSTVGAGDSMVAGIVLSLSQGKSIKEAVQYGIACGTSATMNNGTELCKPADVERLFPLVKMTAVL
jgi:6-phosphofructokinase 2